MCRTKPVSEEEPCLLLLILYIYMRPFLTACASTLSPGCTFKSKPFHIHDQIINIGSLTSQSFCTYIHKRNLCTFITLSCCTLYRENEKWGAKKAMAVFLVRFIPSSLARNYYCNCCSTTFTFGRFFCQANATYVLIQPRFFPFRMKYQPQNDKKEPCQTSTMNTESERTKMEMHSHMEKKPHTRKSLTYATRREFSCVLVYDIKLQNYTHFMYLCFTTFIHTQTYTHTRFTRNHQMFAFFCLLQHWARMKKKTPH